MTPAPTTTAWAIKAQNVLKYAIAVEIGIIALMYGMSGAMNLIPLHMLAFMFLWPVAWKIPKCYVQVQEVEHDG